VGQLIREICEESRQAQPFAFLRTSGLMTIILGEILRGQVGLGRQFNKHIPQLEKAAAFIRERCGDEISAEGASEVAGLSPGHFRKLFGVHYGCSPREYLRQVRINEAKNLMRSSSLNLTEIAQRVGFATVHSFSRAFKEVEGLSPSQYQGYGMNLVSIDK
jgi:AraC-like DNA-binding protein